MNRKTIKTRTGAYHVTLPIRLVEEFDESLQWKASRSKAIAGLMRNHLNNDGMTPIMMSDTQLLAACMSRFKAHSYQWTTLKSMIDHITSQMHDEQSS